MAFLGQAQEVQGLGTSFQQLRAFSALPTGAGGGGLGAVVLGGQAKGTKRLSWNDSNLEKFKVQELRKRENPGTGRPGKGKLWKQTEKQAFRKPGKGFKGKLDLSYPEALRSLEQTCSAPVWTKNFKPSVF